MNWRQCLFKNGNFWSESLDFHKQKIDDNPNPIRPATAHFFKPAVIIHRNILIWIFWTQFFTFILIIRERILMPGLFFTASIKKMPMYTKVSFEQSWTEWPKKIRAFLGFFGYFEISGFFRLFSGFFRLFWGFFGLFRFFLNFGPFLAFWGFFRLFWGFFCNFLGLFFAIFGAFFAIFGAFLRSFFVKFWGIKILFLIMTMTVMMIMMNQKMIFPIMTC